MKKRNIIVMSLVFVVITLNLFSLVVRTSVIDKQPLDTAGFVCGYVSELTGQYEDPIDIAGVAVTIKIEKNGNIFTYNTITNINGFYSLPFCEFYSSDQYLGGTVTVTFTYNGMSKIYSEAYTGNNNIGWIFDIIY